MAELIIISQGVTWVSLASAAFSPYYWVRHAGFASFSMILFAIALNIHHCALSGKSYLNRLQVGNGTEMPWLDGLVFGPFFSWFIALPLALVWTARICWLPVTHQSLLNLLMEDPCQWLQWSLLINLGGMMISFIILKLAMGGRKDEIDPRFFTEVYNAVAYFGGFFVILCLMLLI